MNTKVEKYDNRWIQQFCTKYVWFSSLTGDLVFWAIVDTLFVTLVKGLSATQFTLLSTIPAAVGILIQPYLLKMIHTRSYFKSNRARRTTNHFFIPRIG